MQGRSRKTGRCNWSRVVLNRVWLVVAEGQLADCVCGSGSSCSERNFSYRRPKTDYQQEVRKEEEPTARWNSVVLVKGEVWKNLKKWEKVGWLASRARTVYARGSSFPIVQANCMLRLLLARQGGNVQHLEVTGLVRRLIEAR